MEVKYVQSAGSDVTFSVPTTSRSMLQVRVKVDCRDRLRTDVIESLKKDLMEGNLHYAVILFQGTKNSIIDKKIEETQKSRGLPVPIITTVPLSRREIDVILLHNITGDAIEKEDTDKIKVFELKGETARIKGKIENQIERFIDKSMEEGLIVPEYDLTREDIACLICLSTVAEENLVGTYILVSGEEEGAMTKIERSKKRLRDAKLLTDDGQISMPPFLTRAISAIQDKVKISKASEIAKKFLLADVDDLNNWLEFLKETGLLRKEDERYLLCSPGNIKEELTKLHVQDPPEIDESDEYGGTLRSFLAAHDYEEHTSLLEKWCNNLESSLAKYQLKAEKDTLAEWMANVSLRYVCLRKGLEALDKIIQDAGNALKNSKMVLDDANGKLETHREKIGELNGIIDEIKG